MRDTDAIVQRFGALAPALDERQRRLMAAAEAKALGKTGIAKVARLLRMSPNTIRRGLRELDDPAALARGRVRKPGGGRRREADKDPTLRGDLLALVEPAERGDPESPLRWTCKSVRNLAGQLRAKGHRVGKDTVASLLREEGFSLQANRKTKEGSSHVDRDAQFRHINAKAAERLAAREPVISVDTKKKELVGDFKNAGREWRPAGEPEEVSVHDFVIPGLGRASPYGVYDIAVNKGFVSVGIDHDTAAFAVASIRRWWETMGRERYPRARTLLITADSGGGNGARLRLWKVELQKFADQTGLAVTVCHLPPGTSQWNKIEHRLFSFISRNWRGRPLVSHQVIVDLIASTRTTKGLEVRCELDRTPYPQGVKISDAEMARLRLEPDAFHGEWNYTLRPGSAMTSSSNS